MQAHWPIELMVQHNENAAHVTDGSSPNWQLHPTEATLHPQLAHLHASSPFVRQHIALVGIIDRSHLSILPDTASGCGTVWQ